MHDASTSVTGNVTICNHSEGSLAAARDGLQTGKVGEHGLVGFAHQL